MTKKELQEEMKELQGLIFPIFTAFSQERPEYFNTIHQGCIVKKKNNFYTGTITFGECNWLVILEITKNYYKDSNGFGADDSYIIEIHWHDNSGHLKFVYDYLPDMSNEVIAGQTCVLCDSILKTIEIEHKERNRK